MPIDYSLYPHDWHLRSRFIRFYRARNRCEWCGAINGQISGLSGKRVVLTVAHVHDKRPQACSLLNLAALCQACHLAHDAEQHRESRWATRRAAKGNRELFEI